MDEACAIRAFLERSSGASPPVLEDGRTDGGGLVGTLDAMCSDKEMQDRSASRQLDVFEMAKGSRLEQPVLSTQLAVKKYQRSSADKAYHAEDIRTPAACARSLWHLMTRIVSADRHSASDLCEIAREADYWQVYSFLRDRTRAVRVDLHLQQPWSTTTRLYIVAHEVCLRFEILSMYLLSTRKETLQKYDEKMAQRACSQVMEPLLNAYVQARRRAAQGEGAYLSPAEASMRRYTILLLLVGGEEKKVFEHLPTLPKELLKHPIIRWATEVASAYATGNYNRFLRLYVEADFLSAAILAPVLNLVRQRLLWLLVRSSVPMRRDKLQLGDLGRRLAFAAEDSGPAGGVAEEFLAFNGLEVIELGTGQKIVQLPAYSQRGGTWDVMHDGVRQSAFNERLGQSSLPMKCDFPRRIFLDAHLRNKYQALPFDRADILFGAADPFVGEAPTPAMSATPKPLPRDPAEPVSSPTPSAKAPSAPLSIFGIAEEPSLKTKPVAPISPASTVLKNPFAPPFTQAEATGATAAPTSPPRTTEQHGLGLEDGGTPDETSERPQNTRSPITSALVPGPQQDLQVPPLEECSHDPGPAVVEPGSKALTSPRIGPQGHSPPVDKCQSPKVQGAEPAPQVPPAETRCVSKGAAVGGLAEPFMVEEGVLVGGPAPRVGGRGGISVLRAPDWSKPAAPAAFPQVAGRRVGDELVVYLFRLGRAFAAWSDQWRERRGWAQWARNTCGCTVSRRPPNAAVRALSELPVWPALAAPKVVDAGQALSQAGVPAPACSLCRHRLAVVLPPSVSATAEERAVLTQALGRTVSELFLARASESSTHGSRMVPGDALVAPTSGCAWSARLLQRSKLEHQPQVGVSILEVQPSSSSSSGNGFDGVEDELDHVGPISALLHVLSTPVDMLWCGPEAGLAAGPIIPGGSAMAQAPCWNSEAHRAALTARALGGTGKRQPAVAVLFAVSVPADAAPANAQDLHRVMRKAAEKVSCAFAAALHSELAQATCEQADMLDEAPEVESFCIAVTRYRREGPFIGFTALHGEAAEATAWALGHGAGPHVVPEVRGLSLHERLAGHWSSHCLAFPKGVLFPFSRQQLRQGFEEAVDSCAAELKLILDALPPEFPEWSSAESPSPCGKVNAVRQRLWSLSPPFEEWLALQSPVAFWDAARQYLAATVSDASAPCPSWWQETAPAWDAAVLRVVAPTRPRLGSRLLPARAWGAHTSPPVHQDPEHLSNGAAASGEASCKAPPSNETVAAAKGSRVQSGGTEGAGIAGPEPCAQEAAEPPSKRRRLASVSEMLRRDAAWADSLLRGVANLIAAVPSGL